MSTSGKRSPTMDATPVPHPKPSTSPLPIADDDDDDDDRKELSSNFNNNEKNTVHDSYLKSFPAGYRFQPYDYELVKCYLYGKINGHKLPPNKIMEVELYLHNPEDLAQMYECYGEKQWYFFTPRNRKYPNGTRPNRRAGEGFWKATGADRQITYDGVVIGLKKTLVYYRGKPPKGTKTNWIMHEFRLPADSTTTKRTSGDMRLDTWVLCRIYEKNDKKIQARNHEADFVQEDMSSLILDDATKMEMDVQIEDPQSTKCEEENNSIMDESGYTSFVEEQQPILPIGATTCNDNNIFHQSDPYFQSNASFSAMRSIDYQNNMIHVNSIDVISESLEYKEDASYQNQVIQFPNEVIYSYEKNDVQLGDAIDQMVIMGEAPQSSEGFRYVTEEDSNDEYSGLYYNINYNTYSKDFQPLDIKDFR